ncbi:hypothetical protein L9F63_003552, partial [Diploptera punctata]
IKVSYPIISWIASIFENARQALISTADILIIILYKAERNPLHSDSTAHAMKTLESRTRNCEKDTLNTV